MPKTEQWPYNFTSLDKGVTKFAPVEVTVKQLVLRKADKSVWGWKFEEDETVLPGDFPDAVWSAPEEYDNASGEYQPYKGPKYDKGTRMTVELAVTEKGDKTYFNIRKMTLAAKGSEDLSPAANEHAGATERPHGAIAGADPLPAEWTLPLDYYREKQARERASIQAQTAYNGVVALLNAGAQLDVAEKQRLKAILFDLLDLLVPGLPDLTPGAQAVKTDAEDLPWSEEDQDAVGRPAPKQATMPTGVPVQKAAH